ncbi:unnamed protein product [Adineta steineri]|uniref:Hexosyltransferase n=1 Tax=Adineta steineri TaxID=433720 RepID=A0A814AH67_9BILA|nr:unnamed protein product [Adineta steineri]CAF0913553.1 unnamed protein product [Adineta steineri]
MALISSKQKTSIFRLVLIFIIIISIILFFAYYIVTYHKPSILSGYKKPLELPGYPNFSVNWNNNPRGVIVTLIRSTNRSIARVINMIHSVILFHSTNDNFQYPFLLFHDNNFTLALRQQILSCVRYNNKTIQISFVLLNFETNVQQSNKFSKSHPSGYRLMCRFWSYDVFYHPAIVYGNYDYIMRMDDDSYFIDKTNIDLFQYIDREKLDYAYRSWYREDNNALFIIEKTFLNRTFPRVNCIYNNFFIIRLQWFYRSEGIQRYLHEFIRDDFILREYVGDGCIHAAMLEIDQRVRVKHLTQISYGHNYHIMLPNQQSYFFNYVKEFEQRILNSCHQLIVIYGRKAEVKQVTIKE